MNKSQCYVIRNAELIDPAKGVRKKADIAIEHGKIVALGNVAADFKGTEIEAKGWLVSPGLVDGSVYLREPGFEHKGTTAQETYAAAKGGVSHLVSQVETKPLAALPPVIEQIEQRVTQAGMVNVLPLAALTQDLAGEQLTEYAALKASGAIGLSQGRIPVVNTQVLKNACEYAASHKLPIIVRAKDPYIGITGCAHSSALSTRLGLKDVPVSAETLAISQHIVLAQETGVQIHFSCVSSAESVTLVAAAQKQGLAITADVAITHLYLNENDVKGYDSRMRLDPVLRSREDQDALREGLKSGVLQGICSDHQPHDQAAKFSPFPESEPGASTIECLLPLVILLGEKLKVTLPQALAWVTTKPAACFQVDSELAVGKAANLCLIDPNVLWEVTPDKLASAGKNCPFIGQTMKGKVMATIFEGKKVYEAQV